jgi:enamine deaminase RidA (YjgF/YER057c/UK114 family)
MTENKRLNYSSGVPWEPLRGYSRAVRVGDSLYISGTTALAPSGEIVGTGDPYEQTRYIISVIKKILNKAQFQLTDVVRTRMFVTNISRWEEYARAHSESFDNIRPASSIVQVSKLVDPRLMIEMEAEAILGCKLQQTLSLD